MTRPKYWRSKRMGLGGPCVMHSTEPADETVEPAARTWALALQQMMAALELLDKSDAPPEVGANLDLAIYRLREALRVSGSNSTQPTEPRSR